MKIVFALDQVQLMHYSDEWIDSLHLYELVGVRHFPYTFQVQLEAASSRT